ncbi:hypothetical protein [Micromonospora pisi]|uniref:hypothetical protein n=1 Tax=Micromonospora pisi TaxID=589240 RepID=UPI001477640A|nr:hypothetical protein [Micromonospora pisi]
MRVQHPDWRLYPPVVDYAQHTQRTDATEVVRLLDAAGWRPGPDGYARSPAHH